MDKQKLNEYRSELRKIRIDLFNEMINDNELQIRYPQIRIEYYTDEKDVDRYISSTDAYYPDFFRAKVAHVGLGKAQELSASTPRELKQRINNSIKELSDE